MNLSGREEVKEDSALDANADVTSNKMVLTDLEQSLVEMVMHFHVTVQDASERCYRELSRKNYVTPTSYLELMKCLKSSYKKKYDEITLMRDR